jgi:hypothetical protein
MHSEKKAIIERIKGIEDAISKGREYLESGAHADWRGFRPLFGAKTRDGMAMPPHRDWVRNVFLPRKERSLRYAEEVLRTLERKKHERASDHQPLFHTVGTLPGGLEVGGAQSYGAATRRR